MPDSVRMPFRVITIVLLLGMMMSPGVLLSQPSARAANSFRQEIKVPFDTSTVQGHNQPIDVRVTFVHPCWALDPVNRSIRVISIDGDTTELESQIYDLNFTRPGILSACNVVFIIPPQATGKEHYYVTYSDQKIDAPKYPDHVSISEAYYYFAPIPGYPFQSRYYKITQDNTIIYGVASEGQFLGTSTAQQVTLFKANTTTITTPTQGLAYASYDYFYYTGPGISDFQSTVQHLISKKILIDGNLMVACQIISQTQNAGTQTTATYHYYYNPDPTSHRIYTHVRHQALKPQQTYSSPPNNEASGNIAGLQIGSMRSPSIPDLNFGDLLPYLHLNNNDNRTLEKPLDTNPDYTPTGVPIILTTDDVDLGPKAWICFDQGTTGTATGMIFASTHIIQTGTGETDGIQIKAVEAAGPGLIGLKSNAQTFACSRNDYTKGSAPDYTIPADFIAEFDTEFYSTTTGGYPAIDNESHYYHTGLVTQPINTTNTTTSPVQTPNRYHLTAYVRLAPSFPFGTLMSLLTGKNFSYITAELYKQDIMMASDVAGRLAIATIPSFDNNTNLLQTIRLALGVFDWKNLTLTKKIIFNDLEPGTYLVKIYKEHPHRGEDRRYIGTSIVTLKANTTTRIFCHPEARLQFTVTDQNNTPVNVTTALLIDKTTIALQPPPTTTGTYLTAPCAWRQSYQLNAYYDGFLIYDKPVHLALRNCLMPKKVATSIALYALEVTFQDTWGFPPPGTLAPTLTSIEMVEPQTITARPLGNGSYLFTGLYPARYTLSVSYGTSTYEQEVIIPLQINGPLKIVLTQTYTVTMTTLDSRGLSLTKTSLTITRGGNSTTFSDSGSGAFSCTLPPGTYQASVSKDNTVIAKRTITVIGDRSFTLITTLDPIFPIVVFIGAAGIALVGVILYLRKKDLALLCAVLAVGLAFASIVMPWWSLQGSSTDPMSTTATHLYLMPGSLITFTTSDAMMTGDFASVPDILYAFLTMLVVAIVAGMLLLVLYSGLLRRLPRRLPSIVLIFAGLCFLLAAGGFYLMMSVISKVGVGGVIGQGVLASTLPGESTMISYSSTWGLDLGFYLCLGAVVLSLVGLVFRHRRKSL